MKILVLVIHSENTKERCNNIMSTWGKDVDIFFYSDYEDLKFNVIKVSNRKDYAGCPEKIINVFNKLPESYLDYDWYFFCDDDTFLNTRLLKATLKTFDPNYVHGNIIEGWPEDLSLSYPQGGAGFMISNSTFKKIRSFGVIYNVVWSDVCLGLNIRSLNIKMKHDNRFNIHPPDDSVEKVCEHISFHYVKSIEEIENLYNQCNVPFLI